MDDPTSIEYAVDDQEPEFIQRVRDNLNELVDYTGLTELKFHMRDWENGTYKLQDDTTGVTFDAVRTTGLLHKVWQTGDLDTEGVYRAFFTYKRNSRTETTSAVEVIVNQPYNKGVRP